MPRAQNISVQNSFARGFLTEATALTFPENACTETSNCVFSRIGPVSRREGFDVEARYTNYTASATGNAIVSYLWSNVAGKGDIAFTVVQIGSNLHFYSVKTNVALSSNKHATVIDLTTYMPAGVTSMSSIECQFSSGDGLLFVTNPKLESFYVTYDVDANTIVPTQINLMIRDFDGDASDALAVDSRPAVALAGLTAAHHYNLLNQGWTSTTLTSWDTARADMPSNCDVSWDFKDTSDNFDFTLVDQRAVGNSPAPKGHFTYNVYNINRSSNVSSAVDETISIDRVSTSAFYAGRVFYAGVKNIKASTKIFFSQIVQNANQYGLCYEANDPTSETLFALLPTDGGVIQIQDAGTIYKMLPSLNALVIFCSNGVWALTGSKGFGFEANDYSLSKISSVRTISSTSFIDVDGTPYWWNLDSIYSLTLDSQTNAMKVISITDTTIKTFFGTIPTESKQFVRGTYDPFLKRIQWLYKAVPSVSFEDKYVYDSILSFSLISNAFYPWSVDRTNVKINSIVNIISSGGDYERETVSSSTNNVIAGTDQVIVFEATNSSIDAVTKYLISYTHSGSNVFTFAEVFNQSYVDWEFFDSVGVDYISYFITGYKIKGQGMTRFQQNYINIYSNNSSDCGYKIVGLWNFANTATTGDWSTAQTIEQTFNLPAGDYAVQRKRIKIRGNGLACQFKVSNNGNKPFEIIGWSVLETANRWP